MLEFSKRFIRDESGQDLAEYALLLVLIAVAVIAAFPALSAAITGAFATVTNELNGAGAGDGG